jgi:hypothetical protein
MSSSQHAASIDETSEADGKGRTFEQLSHLNTLPLLLFPPFSFLSFMSYSRISPSSASPGWRMIVDGGRDDGERRPLPGAEE